MTEFSNNGDLHFTDEELEKVKKYLPKEEFIFIQPSSHKPGKSYPIEKYQELVSPMYFFILWWDIFKISKKYKN